MEINSSEKLLEEVIAALRDAGYNPFDQLAGYIQTGDTSYITRAGGARDKIINVNLECVKRYLDTIKK